MHAALVPVRSLAGAKQRLAASIGSATRRELAVAMLADMLEALHAARAVERIAVVSADRTLLGHARSLGAEALCEPDDCHGLNAAVGWAARRLEAEGVRRLLVIPGDVPLVDRAEIDRLFATDGRAHPVVLVPSRSRAGTNGLLLSPPTVIRPRFEGESLVAHRSACGEAGIAPLALELAGFALDIDTPADLAALAASGTARRAARLAASALAADAADTVRPRVRPAT